MWMLLLLIKVGGPLNALCSIEGCDAAVNGAAQIHDGRQCATNFPVQHSTKCYTIVTDRQMISISCFNVQWKSNAPNAQLPTSLIGAVATSCLPHCLAQRPTLVFRRSCGRSKTAFPLRAALPKPSEFVLSKLQPGPKLHSSSCKLAANSKTHLLALD